MSLDLLYQLALTIAIVYFLRGRLLRYLRFLQQEEYSPSHFIDWYRDNRAFDRRGTVVCLFILLSVVVPAVGGVIDLLVVAGLILISISEANPCESGKKKLVMTKRATGIFNVALTLLLIFLALCLFSGNLESFSTLFVLMQSPPFFLILAVILLAPSERQIQQKLLAEANQKFMRVAPFSIGITGSFGKTSVKNLLGEVLSMTLGATFYPQKGVNTEMGITREIRERMKDEDKYAVIEMGAYYIGSIKKLCNLTPVSAAIITAVHRVHLDRFGGEEEVYTAKSELAAAVPEDGILLVNGDNDGARRMAREFTKKTTLIYGIDPSKGHLDCQLLSWKSSPTGTSFEIRYQEAVYSGETRLHGKGALLNILATFTMAVTLGADPEFVLAVIKDQAPVSNRLEVVQYPNYIQINDAYNSNPLGFGYALEVLRDMPGERRILITPGMIELGNTQFAENKAIAAFAADICDDVVIVSEVNKEALIAGLREKSFPSDRIHVFPTRDEALAWYSTVKQKGDTLLIENDLPDAIEYVEKF